MCPGSDVPPQEVLQRRQCDLAEPALEAVVGQNLEVLTTQRVVDAEETDIEATVGGRVSR